MVFLEFISQWNTMGKKNVRKMRAIITIMRMVPTCRLKVVLNGLARWTAINAFGPMFMGDIYTFDNSPATLSEIGQ